MAQRRCELGLGRVIEHDAVDEAEPPRQLGRLGHEVAMTTQQRALRARQLCIPWREHAPVLDRDQLATRITLLLQSVGEHQPARLGVVEQLSGPP